MTAAMFVLLVTAFFPVVTIHWIAGLGLALTIVYHMIYAWFWEDRKSMGIGPEDIMEASQGVGRFFRRSGPPPSKAGKYPVDHKLYHHIIALVSLGAIVTGPDRHSVLGAQSLPAVGPTVGRRLCRARCHWRGAHYVGHGPRLLRDPS
jgi:hypothetical protein